jgi:hypothetical protein
MNTLDHTLELLAARDIDDAAVQDAQRKLEAAVANRLTGRAPRATRSRGVGGWLAAAVSAGIAILTFLWLPLMSAPTFAAVQEHFRDFRTMRFVIDQRVAGEQVIQTRVSMTNDGNVLTEIGDDVSVIVNSREKRVLTLMHSAHMAIVSPLVAGVEKDDSLKWLKDIREFQGKAQALPEPRVINGEQARGWRLVVGGLDIVLWATDEGLPLAMTMNGEPRLALDFRFEFNVPLSAAAFSTEVPAGYSLGTQED